MTPKAPFLAGEHHFRLEGLDEAHRCVGGPISEWDQFFLDPAQQPLSGPRTSHRKTLRRSMPFLLSSSPKQLVAE
ncbi:unnamed protein product, partial [Iphiclides podalirius]